MRKIPVIALLVCAFFSAAFAEGVGGEAFQLIRFGVNVDYTLGAFDKVNADLNKGGSVSNLGSGINAMLDFDVAVAPFLMAGIRGGYLYCLPAKASYNYIIYNQVTTINASLIPLEAGISANFDLPSTPVSLMAGIYGGYGIASATYKNDIGALGQTANFTQSFDGGGFVGELLACINYKLASGFSLSINGGYRLAKITKMTQTENVNYSPITGLTIPIGVKGDVLKDSDNNNMVFDYSGFNAGLGISLGF